MTPCPKCNEELDMDCNGNLRCPTCDGPCLSCTDVNEDEDDDDDDDDDEVVFDEPEEDDYRTGDHHKFYQYGKLAVEVPAEHDWEPYVKKHMLENQFYPNVWWISDHGNANLLSWNFDETDVDKYNFDKITKTFSREQCVDSLESIGIQCYDDEDVGILREAVCENLRDGTLEPW